MIGQIIAGMELVLIVLPTTALALWMACATLSAPSNAESIAYGITLAVALSAICGMWRLLIPFMFGGYQSIEAAAPIWWLAIAMGGVLVVVGFPLPFLVILFFYAVETVLSVDLHTPIVSAFGPVPSAVLQSVIHPVVIIAISGLPMLLPLVHLAIERRRYLHSNKTIEPTR